MCQHPNIVGLLEIYETLENLYLVMDLMKGGDLYDYFKKKENSLPEE